MASIKFYLFIINKVNK